MTTIPTCAHVARAFRYTISLLPLLAVLTGCGGSDEREPVQSRERTIVPVKWSMLWRAGGPDQDSVILFPIGLLAADAEHVYVPDAGAFRVAAFRVRDGSLAWTYGRRGRGPGEFSGFAAIAINHEGEIVVADNRNARLTVLGRDGVLRREISSNHVPSIESFCPLPGGEYLISTGISEREPLLHVSATGEVDERYKMPWTELREAPAIKRQLYAVSAGQDACVLALKLGQGFSVFRNGRVSSQQDYVEPLQLPEVEVSTRDMENGGSSRRERLLVHQAGPSGVSTNGDTLVVPFVGRTADAARVVDLYGVAPGIYMHSYLLPWRVDAVVRQGEVHFALRLYKGHPALFALRMHADTPGIAK